MYTLQVGEFKARFSEVLKQIQEGKEFVISYGKNNKKLAALIPYGTFIKKLRKRKLGILEGKAHFRMSKNFKITDEKFLKS